MNETITFDCAGRKPDVQMYEINLIYKNSTNLYHSFYPLFSSNSDDQVSLKISRVCYMYLMHNVWSHKVQILVLPLLAWCMKILCVLVTSNPLSSALDRSGMQQQ